MEVLAGQIAGRLPCLGDEGQSLFSRSQVGGEAALVADVGVVTRVLQSLLQRVEDFSAHAQGVREGVGAGRQDHELLNVDRIVGVSAAVDDVHHRSRQDASRDAADVAIQRQVRADGAGLGRSQRDAQDGVGAQTSLVVGAVQFDQGLVQTALVLGVHAGQGVEDLAVDGVDRLLDALAAPHVHVAVAQLDRLVSAGRGARGHGGAAEAAVFQGDVHLDRRITPAVDDLAGDDVGDVGHVEGALSGGEVLLPV
ncbi:hypothetical protein D3C80_984610 [compost metagenome]